MKQADRVRYAAPRQHGELTVSKRREMLEAYRDMIAQKLIKLIDTMALMHRKVAAYHAMKK